MKETNSEDFNSKFAKEGVYTEDLIEMTEKGLKEAMKEFGIKSLGDRFRILKVNLKSIKPKESEEHKEESDEEQEQEDNILKKQLRKQKLKKHKLKKHKLMKQW